MGVRILSTHDDCEQGAVMVSSSTGTCFGPVFDDANEIESFLEWLDGDPRGLDDAELTEAHAAWKLQFDLNLDDLARGSWLREKGIDLEARRRVSLARLRSAERLGA